MTKNKKVNRKLSAILSADVKGYSLLMVDDEVHTIETLKAYRRIIAGLISGHSGRIVDSPGDNILAEFRSVVDAVDCSAKIQRKLGQENSKYVEDKKVQFRIGINIGDVIQDGNRIYGNGVNIASRIEGLSEPGGICVSRNAYDQVKDNLEIAFQYLGEHEVKNIREPVRVYKVLLDSDSQGPLVKDKLELPDKPSIAVLPFTNMSGDPSQEYFSDGLTEQIINGLCKVSNLFVIARNSSFAYKGKAVSVKQIAKELGVRYILEGSVQRAGNRVRITAQLIDATTDYHIWSENYDRDLEDIFALQDEITMKLIESMAVQLTHGQQAHLWIGGTNNFQAFELFLKGIELFNKLSKNDIAEARRLFKDAIKCDELFVKPNAFIAYSHVVDLFYGWSISPTKSFQQAEKYVQKFLEYNHSSEIAHIVLSCIYLYKRQHEAAKNESEKAILLNPNGADAHINCSFTLSFMRETKLAVSLGKRAFRLNPIPHIYYYYHHGLALGNDCQYEEAINYCMEGIKLNPHVIASYPTLIRSLVCIDKLVDARRWAKEFIRLAPKFSLTLFRSLAPYKERADADAHIETLRIAGLPE